MGRGNVYVDGSYEGLFYIENAYLHVYRRDDRYADWPETRLKKDLSNDELSGNEWIFDNEGSDNEESDVIECLCNTMMKLCPGFEKTGDDRWISQKRRAILENRLFYICVEDNEWSLAVELVQRDENFWQLTGLQGRHYERYLECMKIALLSRLPRIGIYTGPWTHGTLTKEEFENG